MTNSEQILQLYFSYIATLTNRSQFVRKAALRQYNDYILSLGKTLLSAGLVELISFASYKLENTDPEKNISRLTFKTYLKYITYFYQFATDEDHYSTKELKRLIKYARDFSVEKGEEKTRLSHEHVLLLIEEINCHPTLKTATWLILNFGFRVSELVNLKVSDIDFEKQLITIHSGKGRKTRRLPILDYQLPSIKKILEQRQEFLPLTSKETQLLINANTGKKIYINWLQDYYVRISKRLGFRVHAHRLRRTFASILYFDLHIDIYLISWLLGHASIQTTILYLGITEKQKITSYKEAMQAKAIIHS